MSFQRRDKCGYLIRRGYRTSLTMSALSNLFLSALLPSLPRVVLFVFFDLGIDDHGSFVI